MQLSFKTDTLRGGWKLVYNSSIHQREPRRKTWRANAGPATSYLLNVTPSTAPITLPRNLLSKFSNSLLSNIQRIVLRVHVFIRSCSADSWHICTLSKHTHTVECGTLSMHTSNRIHWLSYLHVQCGACSPFHYNDKQQKTGWDLGTKLCTRVHLHLISWELFKLHKW